MDSSWSRMAKKGPLNTIRVVEAAHPVPDQRSFDACREVVRIADKAGMHDLVFCLMSGGVSSLCISPIADISIADKIEMNRLLVHCGADVTEIMTVRRHLSRIKGGRLAARLHPATIVTLTVSDAIGDPSSGTRTGPAPTRLRLMTPCEF